MLSHTIDFVIDQVMVEFGAEEELLLAIVAVVGLGMGTVLLDVQQKTRRRCEYRRTDVTVVAALLATGKSVLDQMFLQLDAGRKRLLANVAAKVGFRAHGNGAGMEVVQRRQELAGEVVFLQAALADFGFRWSVSG
jgi:hypothetical protein